MRIVLVFLVKPAPGSAYCRVPVEPAVVVQDIDCAYTIIPEKTVYLGRGVPPIIVVALENYFSSGRLSMNLKSAGFLSFIAAISHMTQTSS